ncbi:MAG: glycosyltransferase [Bacteroidia bacterium]
MELNVELAGKISFTLFLAFFVIQIFYYLFLFGKLAFLKKQKTSYKEHPVSVVICARNELKNLRNNLPKILEQDYKNYQVIVVNDCSWDETENFLEEYADAYPHLKIVTIKEQERYKHGKKFAVTLGIKAADHDIILLTDADCYPTGKNWLSEMTKNIGGSKQIAIGYGAYEKKPGLLNKWIRMDTAFNAVQYLSYALSKIAYMGVGRNLCYSKSLFFKNKGFASHNHLLSGDDDLFVNEVATKNNVVVELNPESFTYSKLKETFTAWLKQKKRHMSTGMHYKAQHQLQLGLFYLSHIFFYLLFAMLITISFQIKIALIIFFRE